MDIIEAWRPFVAIGMVFIGLVVLGRNSRRTEEPWEKSKEPQGMFLGAACIVGGLALLVILFLMITIARLEAI